MAIKEQARVSHPSKANLKQGIEALQIALRSLVLSAEEKRTLERILKLNLQALERLGGELARPKKEPTKTLPSQPASAPKTVKATGVQKSLLKRRAQMLEQKRLEEIAETHKKSKFSSFLVRVGGSFEGGKKR